MRFLEKNYLPQLADRESQIMFLMICKMFRDFFSFSISAPVNSGTIKKYAEDFLRNKLLGIPGVADVNIYGGTEREIKIEMDYLKISNLGITSEEIINSVSNTTGKNLIGYVPENGKNMIINIKGSINAVDLLENQTVKALNNGTIIKLRDVATVVEVFNNARSFYRINGKETISVVIAKESGTNTIQVADKIIEKIQQLEKHLPAGYSISIVTDRSKQIKNEINNLFEGALFSIIIIALITILIFRDFRYSVIIFLSMLFSVLFSLALFYLFNISLNILTISAFILGFGFIVDNSIVVLDYMNKKYTGRGIKNLAVILKDIFPPVFAGTLTTVAVFFPLLFFSGEFILYFKQLILGISFTLSSSLIVSFTVVPASYIMIIKPKFEPDIISHSKLYSAYHVLLTKITLRPKITLILILFLIGIPIWLLPSKIETPFLRNVYNPIFGSQTYKVIKPYMNYIFGGCTNLFINHLNRINYWQEPQQTSISIRLSLPNGNKIERINGLTKEFEKDILEYQERLDNVVTRVFNEENASIVVNFPKMNSADVFPLMLQKFIIAKSSKLGGLDITVIGVGEFFSNFNSSTTGFQVGIKGYNYNKVRELAHELKQLLEANPHVENVDVDLSENYFQKTLFEVNGYIDKEKTISL